VSGACRAFAAKTPGAGTHQRRVLSRLLLQPVRQVRVVRYQVLQLHRERERHRLRLVLRRQTARRPHRVQPVLVQRLAVRAARRWLAAEVVQEVCKLTARDGRAEAGLLALMKSRGLVGEKDLALCAAAVSCGGRRARPIKRTIPARHGSADDTRF